MNDQQVIYLFQYRLIIYKHGSIFQYLHNIVCKMAISYP